MWVIGLGFDPIRTLPRIKLECLRKILASGLLCTLYKYTQKCANKQYSDPLDLQILTWKASEHYSITRYDPIIFALAKKLNF